MAVLNKVKKVLRKALVANLMLFSGVTGFLGGDRQNSRVAGHEQDDADMAAVVQTENQVVRDFSLGTVLSPADDAAGDATAQNPRVCVDSSDLDAMKEKLPNLSKDFQIMTQLSLTGKSVYEVMTDAKNNITTCVFYVPSGTRVSSSYWNKRLEVSSNRNTTTTLHEAFHAAQDLDKGFMRAYTLTQRDAAIADLLSEATAVAYSLVALQEAKSHGVAFHFGLSSTASNDPDNVLAFQAAYDKAWADNASADAKTRAVKALETAGQALVRHLMNGKDKTWAEGYVEPTLVRLRQNAGWLCNDRREFSPGYISMRDGLYTQMGKVSEQINLTPPEFLGDDTNEHIIAAFLNVGMLMSKLPVLQDKCTEGPTVVAAAQPSPVRLVAATP